LKNSLFSLEDRVAIVTGAGRGLGKAISLGLADAGAHIVAAARTKDEIEATVDEVCAKGRKALALPTDVTDKNQMDKLVQRTVQEFGRLDIMVNNAGGTWIRAPLLEIDEKYFDEIINLNLKSVFLGCKAAAEVMVEQKSGNIINMGSLAGTMPNSGSIPYNAAKAGVISLTQSLALELGPYNIRVNALAPGQLMTDITATLARKDPVYLETRKNNTALKRIGAPEEIVGAVVYLASDAASYVTGTTVVVSGGMHTLVV